jgi:hypothetical protein
LRAVALRALVLRVVVLAAARDVGFLRAIGALPWFPRKRA